MAGFATPAPMCIGLFTGMPIEHSKENGLVELGVHVGLLQGTSCF